MPTDTAGGQKPVGPLVSVDELHELSGEPGVRIIHVSPDRSVYDVRHIRGAVFAPLYEDLAVAGRDEPTGQVERHYLIPDRAAIVGALRRWGAGTGDRLVFYDDIGMNRHATRAYWLLRYHGCPDGCMALLDGGLGAWLAAGQESVSEVPSVADPGPIELGPGRPDVLASLDQVRDWSRESTTGGPPRLLDVRSPAEYRGEDVQARRGGHVPGAANLEFSSFLDAGGRFRSASELRALATEAAGGDAGTLRATYCQGGIRASLAWFALHELAGLRVANYALSWEEWGNRTDTEIVSA